MWRELNYYDKQERGDIAMNTEVATLVKAINQKLHLLDPQVVSLILFGSFARNEQTIYSDFDIAVVFAADIKVSKGYLTQFREDMEDAIEKRHRKIGWFPTNEFKLKNATHLFDTNTRIREEGITLWKQTATLP